ncbi:hypothetical protein J2Z62_000496 [Mycoplasmoides fastidiosum]|uniref:DUF31 domain-containing protein n=1 Tax=Mycoplasmoides fastidiosum TaxID=92758 RepID=A0ABU0LZC0_9BACT|nr:hypothetical protein [Mycoplasmoides fastidiosum]MDQ0514058.1 hypothetical protein [Mycoplasmoides fastidiosum]UUD37531.1 hypothetical protein NPA10_03110 [Mycoplasmoides fastidiosum]
MKFKWWKRNKTSQNLKIIIPFTLLVGSISVTTGYLVSPSGSQLFTSNASLEAGYDQNFRVPIYQNKYKDFETTNGNLRVIQKPNLKTTQSLELKANTDYNPKTFNDAVNLSIVHSRLDSISNSVHKSIKLFQASFTKEQFETTFANRFSPDLGFIFKVKFSGPDGSGDNVKTVAYNQGLITGFSLDDLIRTKSRRYRIFDYAVNDDFANLQGMVSAFMDINIDKRGNFSVDINLDETELSTQNPEWNSGFNQFKVEFEKWNNDLIFQPAIFWNLNTTNDLERWYWPNPLGPAQNPKITVPVFQDSAVVGNDQYTVTNHNNAVQKYNYQLVQDFENVSKNIVNSNNPDELVNIKFQNQSWQTNFFNDWPNKGVAKNPGAQVKFDLFFDARDAEYGQKQHYKTTVYGYFNFSNLQNGAEFNQEIVNYDLSQGRLKNFGLFQVLLNARVNLRGELLIKLQTQVHNLLYQASPLASDVAQSDFLTTAKIDNIQISRYYDGDQSLTPIDKTTIGPNREFTHNVARSNIEVVNNKIDGALRTTDRLGRQVRKSSSAEPYLYHYYRVWSKEQTEDFSSYIEHDKEFANKVLISFKFSGTNQTNNQTNPVLDTLWKNRIMSLGKRGLNLDGSDAGVGQTTLNADDTNDPYTSFSIPFAKIGSYANNDQFWFKKFYAFDTKPYREVQFDRYLFNLRASGNDNYSAMRVIYYIKLTKVGDFSFAYKIGMDVSAYQWSRKHNSASQGRAGLKVDSINFSIGK